MQPVREDEHITGAVGQKISLGMQWQIAISTVESQARPI